MTTETTIADVQQTVADGIARCKQTINDFKDRLETNPVYAFQLADDAIKAAAYESQLYTVQKTLEMYVKRVDTDEPISPVDITADLDDFFVQEMKGARLSGSTSASSRNMNLAATEQAVNWFATGFGHHLRKQIIDALRNDRSMRRGVLGAV